VAGFGPPLFLCPHASNQIKDPLAFGPALTYFPRMKNRRCPCGSGKNLTDCCGRWLAARNAPTAEALMRSRYTAYVLKKVDYLVETTAPASRTLDLATEIRQWMNQVEWMRLHVLSTEAGCCSDAEGTVAFVAEYVGLEGAGSHHENSRFKKTAGKWYYVDGEVDAEKEA
jgi:SEC-C motif-containing protein